MTTIPTFTDADRDEEFERESIIVAATPEDARALKRAEEMGIADGRGIHQLTMPDPKALHQSREAALEAIAGEYGVESPAISRVGWLQTLLKEIDETPAIKELLMRDDPSSMHDMLQECRALVDEGMAAIEILRQPA